MCTAHCFLRGFQRFGFNVDVTTDVTERAYFKGRSPYDFNGREKEFLIRKVVSHPGTEVKVYCGKIFIFDALETCVTMFPLPAWFGRQKMHIRKFEDSFDDIFEGCEFADILYFNQVMSVLRS